jgi:hypothetical protein
MGPAHGPGPNLHHLCPGAKVANGWAGPERVRREVQEVGLTEQTCAGSEGPLLHPGVAAKAVANIRLTQMLAAENRERATPLSRDGSACFLEWLGRGPTSGQKQTLRCAGQA